MTTPEPNQTEIELTVNGKTRQLTIDPDERLLDTLRTRLRLTGTKEGCGEGECGACTVLLDGNPVNACLVPTIQTRNRSVETIESTDPQTLEPMLESGATQCGACTPGVVMTARWVRENTRLLEEHTPRELMAGNLCRCTGYDGIIEGLAASIEADRHEENSNGAPAR